MKTFVIAAFLMIASAAQAADANKPLPKADAYSVEFTRISVDRAYFAGEIESASLLLVRPEKKAVLTLRPAFSCPAGRLCAMVMPRPIRIELPIVSSIWGNCGEKIYVARKDTRIADGELKELVIVDNRTNLCPSEVAYPSVVATLETQTMVPDGGTPITTRSVFEGDDFVEAELPPVFE